MARTRSTKPSGPQSKEASQPTSTSSKYSLEPRSDNPPKLFVLPKKAADDARIVTLPDPRTSRPSRYFVCPKTGFFEFKKIAAPKTTPRSWLIETTKKPSEASQENENVQVVGQVTANADLFIATPIDPMFLVLPALAESKGAKGADGKKALFLSSEDYFDKLPQETSHFLELLKSSSIRTMVESRMGAICDTVEAGDEVMFRLNEDKLISVLVDKARRMGDNGLPATMEDKFVKKPLEAPMAVQKRGPAHLSGSEGTGDITGSAASTPVTESVDSQSTVQSVETTTTSVSQPSSAATSFASEANEPKSAIEASPEITSLQRLRVAFDFICSSYIAPQLANRLLQLLRTEDQSIVDLASLDKYLAEITKLRSEALAARSVGDYTRKHGRDEEENEVRAEKKRKMEEEKRKKATETRGVRDLKKVNTSGMMKLSAFFKKK